MPQTTSKRLALTVKPHVYKTIERLAKAQKKSMASVIAELLEEQDPLLSMMADAFEAALRGQAPKATQTLQAMAGKALVDLGGVMQGKGKRKGGQRKSRK